MKLTRCMLGRRADKKFDSKAYWVRRYKSGDNSGEGSYGASAEWKLSVLLGFIQSTNGRVKDQFSIIELGCGDGNNLASLPKDLNYTGIDPSPDAIKRCLAIHRGDRSKSYFCIDPDTFTNNESFSGDLALSMEVILHLTENHRFEKHLIDLFSCSTKYVGIFNTATDINPHRMGKHNMFRDHRPFISKNFPTWRELSVSFTPQQLGFHEGTGFWFYVRADKP